MLPVIILDSQREAEVTVHWSLNMSNWFGHSNKLPLWDIENSLAVPATDMILTTQQPNCDIEEMHRLCSFLLSRLCVPLLQMKTWHGSCEGIPSFAWNCWYMLNIAAHWEESWHRPPIVVTRCSIWSRDFKAENTDKKELTHRWLQPLHWKPSLSYCT